ncbi:YggT family protein [candidate division KSB1 bacterium]
MNIFLLLLDLYMLVLVARVAISWLRLDSRNPIVSAVYSITEPVLAPIRRMLPVSGGLDFSPLIVFFAIYLIKRWFFLMKE